MVLIAGASAITDRHDVLPAGIVAAGGIVEHFGMPVDPGNLLLLARLDGRVGPGPARLLPLAQAQRPRLGAAAIGGRASRHRPRHHGHGRRRPAERDSLAPATAGGQYPTGTGRPPPSSWPAASRAAWAARTSCCSRWRASPWSAMSSRLPWPRGPIRSSSWWATSSMRSAKPCAASRCASPHNPEFAEGLSTSLRAGLAALPAEASGAVVCLGDMPRRQRAR